MMLPSMICEAISINGKNNIYDKHVMTTAWSSFITVILMTFISYFYTKYFTQDDAIDALQGMNKGIEKFSQSIVKISEKEQLKMDDIKIKISKENERENDHNTTNTAETQPMKTENPNASMKQ